MNSKLIASVVGALAGAGAVFGALSVESNRLFRPPPPDTVWMAEMTWPEYREALRQGVDTVLVPVGGTEQGGLHLALGKHDRVVADAVERAARRLGRTLVAPVMPYAPEGEFAPPSANLLLPGTIGISPAAMEAVAEGIARSLKLHGVRIIAFVADHGLTQAPLATVARRLNAEWPGGPLVLHLADYYHANGQTEWLLERGETSGTIGYHAGIRDTSELMFVWPDGVRNDRLVSRRLDLGEATGAVGDPGQATAETGRAMIELKIDRLVAAITKARRRPPRAAVE